MEERIWFILISCWHGQVAESCSHRCDIAVHTILSCAPPDPPIRILLSCAPPDPIHSTDSIRARCRALLADENLGARRMGDEALQLPPGHSKRVL